MRKTAHMLLLCAVCVVGVGIARPADSLEDFEDSQRRRPSRPRRPAGPAPALTAPPPLVVAPAATYSAQNPADPLSTSLAFDMIVGDNPGTRFSFGLSPWRGRVRLQAPATNSDGFASPHGQGLIGYANPNVRSWRDTPDNRGALSPLDPKVQALYGDSATNALKPGMAEYLGLITTRSPTPRPARELGPKQKQTDTCSAWTAPTRLPTTNLCPNACAPFTWCSAVVHR
jgi:hypothetical protein